MLKYFYSLHTDTNKKNRQSNIKWWWQSYEDSDSLGNRININCFSLWRQKTFSTICVGSIHVVDVKFNWPIDLFVFWTVTSFKTTKSQYSFSNS